jgi:2,4'-dihydroxyacetophenone dioxygenase
MLSSDVLKADEEHIPYALPQVPFMSPDMVHSGVLKDWMDDDRMWVPMTATVAFKPCLLSASNGYFTNILRVRHRGFLSRHRHAGAVHALVLRGRWHYLEHAH